MMQKILMRTFSIPSLIVMVSAVMLTVWGNLTIFSIRPTLSDNQILFSLVGLILYLIIIQINLSWTQKFSWAGWILAIVLLILPLIIGGVVRGSARWIDLGFIKFQPAEFTRPILFMVFGSIIQSQILNLKKIFILLGLMIIPFTLIRIEPDLGSALLLFIGWVGLIFQAGFKWKYILISLLFLIIIAPIVWNALHDYQRERIITFVNPQHDIRGAGYNVIQAQIAIGSGNLFGKGLGQGSQSQLRFLPENHTDFIYASLAEEFGFVGTVLLLILYSIILLMMLKIINDSDQTDYHRLVVCGIFTSFLAQTFINLGMNLGIMPVTGVTLPLISYGGSSLIATWISLGLVVNFALRKPKPMMTHIH